MDTIPKFSFANYFVFGGMLALSAFIGVYFGFFAKKKPNTTKEYLLGGKSMNFFPISASLIASHLSGATFLAVPAGKESMSNKKSILNYYVHRSLRSWIRICS